MQSHTNRNFPLRRALPGLLIASVIGCGDRSTEPAPSDSPLSLVLISIDSLRADHLRCYGYDRATSPRMDALAAEGVRFDNVTSTTSWTLPSHAALFTALPDSIHGCDRNSRVLAPERTTLAEVLREAGYTTAGFFSGPYLHPRFGMAQGFDSYESCAGYEMYSEQSLRSSQPNQKPKGQNRAHGLAHSDITSPRIVDSVKTWLKQRPEGPFFLFLHFWDVHYDYIAPEPFGTMFDPDYTGPEDGRRLSNPARLEGIAERDLQHIVARYDGEIAWTDHHIGKIIDLLDSAGLRDQTVLAVTADHGEEFFEHGQFGHHKELYRESIAIPWILRAPGLPPDVVREPVALVDIAPTLLDLLDLPPLQVVAGRSLAPRLNHQSWQPSDYRLSELVRLKKGNLASLRTEDWMLLLQPEPLEWKALFDLKQDADETAAIAKDDPRWRTAEATWKRAQEHLDRLRQAHELSESSEGGALNTEMEEQLRALGYLNDQ